MELGVGYWELGIADDLGVLVRKGMGDEGEGVKEGIEKGHAEGSLEGFHNVLNLHFGFVSMDRKVRMETRRGGRWGGGGNVLEFGRGAVH